MPKALVSTTWPQCMLTRRGPLGARADAVAPVVVVGEAAAGPAEVRDVDRAEGVEDVGAHAAGVGDRRIFADPDAVVDAAAEVLGEVAVEVAADRAAVLVAVDDGLGLERLGGGTAVGRCDCSTSDERGETRENLNVIRAISARDKRIWLRPW